MGNFDRYPYESQQFAADNFEAVFGWAKFLVFGTAYIVMSRSLIKWAHKKLGGPFRQFQSYPALQVFATSLTAFLLMTSISVGLGYGLYQLNSYIPSDGPLAQTMARFLVPLLEAYHAHGLDVGGCGSFWNRTWLSVKYALGGAPTWLRPYHWLSSVCDGFATATQNIPGIGWFTRTILRGHVKTEQDLWGNKLHEWGQGLVDGVIVPVFQRLANIKDYIRQSGQNPVTFTNILAGLKDSVMGLNAHLNKMGLEWPKWIAAGLGGGFAALKLVFETRNYLKNPPVPRLPAPSTPGSQAAGGATQNQSHGGIRQTIFNVVPDVSKKRDDDHPSDSDESDDEEHSSSPERSRGRSHSPR